MVLHLLFLLGLADRPHVSSDIAASAAKEAAAIWLRYGVELEATLVEAERDRVAAENLSIVVDMAPHDVQAGAGAPLGTIKFGSGRAPHPIVSIFSDAVGRLVAEWMFHAVRIESWPERMRAALLGRALGRVIAHEIGHYLLGPRHTAGLMRSAFAAGDLLDPPQDRFMLSPADVRRLDQRMLGSDCAAVRP
jgi:hypothetical protein